MLKVGGGPPREVKKPRKLPAVDPIETLADFLSRRGGDGPALAKKFSARPAADGRHGLDYVNDDDGAVYKSRAQVARALLDLRDDCVDVFWDGGCGAWYSAIVTERKPTGASLVVYEDGTQEWLRLARAPHDAPTTPQTPGAGAVPETPWKPTGEADGSDGALLEFSDF